jgi:hypothetical protein
MEDIFASKFLNDLERKNLAKIEQNLTKGGVIKFFENFSYPINDK